MEGSLFPSYPKGRKDVDNFEKCVDFRFYPQKATKNPQKNPDFIVKLHQKR